MADAKGHLYSVYKSRSKKKNLDFLLTKKELKFLVEQNCHYCGREPENEHIYVSGSNTDSCIYNGIDRVDNSKGYIKENCVSSCFLCNKAKGSMTRKEFLAFIERIAKYNNMNLG